MAYGTVNPSAAALDAQESAVAADNSASSPGSPPTPDDGTATDGVNGSPLWQKTKAFYDKNIGLFYVALGQLFASIMAMTTRLLETGFNIKFHALQIIFVRMLATGVIGSLYMWRKRVPDFPFGPPGVRRLLVVRGLSGATGLFCLYYSLSYLDIADATVITFLVPTITAFVCWVALHEPFTIREAAAGLIAFVGVLFIARPVWLFRHDHAVPNVDGSGHAETGEGILPPDEVSPAERSFAVVLSIIGSFAAATSYAIIRVIGKRTHSLVSVNYFAVLATVSSFLIILIHPGLEFEIPQSPLQWTLLLSIGISGFLFQVLHTEGLRREKAGRATNLIYTQMIFALIIERVVWGTTPPLTSLFGSALIIASAVWVTLQKKTTAKPETPADEERRLLNEDDQTARD